MAPQPDAAGDRRGAVAGVDVTAAKLAYTVSEAADLASVSSDTIRRAIHTTDGPSLVAKRVGRKYLITADALRAWLAAHPDA